MGNSSLQNTTLDGPRHKFLMPVLTQAPNMRVRNLSAIFAVAYGRSSARKGARSIFGRPGTGISSVGHSYAFTALDKRQDPRTINEDRRYWYF